MPPARPKVIFFDVNETLLDLAHMRPAVADALGGRADLLPLWFSTMLHHSLVENATGRYHGLGDVGVAALRMVAESNGMALSVEDARRAILPALTSLPPHPEVKAALATLSERGYVLASLTNSSSAGLQKQFENASLMPYFARRLSVDALQVYKPDLAVYEWAAREMGIELADGLLVAAHGWDVAGAKAAGLQTAFVRRPGKVLYPLALPPDYIVKDLTELVRVLG
ncbi:MAG: haloacid dehalogenase type II [Bacteroidota bacterium]